ncbi:MAG: hypothetical protein ACK4WH_09145 [Phycisphaerales bacterium]
MQAMMTCLIGVGVSATVFGAATRAGVHAGRIVEQPVASAAGTELAKEKVIKPETPARLEVTGDFAKAIVEARGIRLLGEPKFVGHIELRPKTCDPEAPDVSETVVAFDLSAATEDGAMCVFQVLLTKGSKGRIVASKDVPHCPAGEPVFELTEGSAVLAGTRPVGKGRRSRAGAPGTWFAIEIVGDKEYHYLLSDDAEDAYTVEGTDQYGTKVSDDLLTNPTREYFLTVMLDGTMTKEKLDDHPDRLAARNTFLTIAQNCPAPLKEIDREVIAAFRRIIKEKQLKPAPK